MKLPGFLIKAGAKLSDASPDILMVVGIGSLFAAGVVACLKTQSLNDILDEQQEKTDEIVENHSEDELQLPEVKHELTKIKIGTVGRIAWHYAPAAGLTALGVTSVLVGHHILKGRYLAAVAGYNVLQKAYDTVIDRVQSKWGDEGVKWAKYGIEQEEYEVEEIDEKGKKKKVKKTRDVVKDNAPSGSPYMIVFGPGDDIYDSCGGSIVHMRSQLQIYENGENEVYNNGFPVMYDDIVKMCCGADSEKRTDERLRDGWYKRDINNREAGDDYIDFRIGTFNGCDPETGEDKQYIFIDPNVPGIVSLNAANKVRRGGKYISQA